MFKHLATPIELEVLFFILPIVLATFPLASRCCRKKYRDGLKKVPGLVNFIPAAAYLLHFCLDLPAEFLQPRDHFLAQRCNSPTTLLVLVQYLSCAGTATLAPEPALCMGDVRTSYSWCVHVWGWVKNDQWILLLRRRREGDRFS